MEATGTVDDGLPKDDAGHDLTKLIESPYGDSLISCNGCHENCEVSSSTPCYSCKTCEDDYCQKCYTKMLRKINKTDP